MSRRTPLNMLVLATAMIAGTLLATSANAPAYAQPGRACLQSNRIWSSSAIDDRTLVVNDRSGNLFVVNLSGGCLGLTRSPGRMSFSTRTRLGCVGPGDRVSFRDPVVGRNTCFVRNVTSDLTILASRRPTRPFTRVF